MQPESGRGDRQGQPQSVFKDRSFGRTANVLVAAGLTNNQIDKVKAATREDIKQQLNKAAGKAVERGRVANKRVWTTEWRGVAYTIDSFPYGSYVTQMFAGTESSCWAYKGTYGEYAYRWCLNTTVLGWQDYWQEYADKVDKPQPQLDMACRKEIVIGATTGAAAGVVAGLWAGPGVGAGAGIGVVGGGVAGLVGCATDALGQAVGWWE